MSPLLRETLTGVESNVQDGDVVMDRGNSSTRAAREAAPAGPDPLDTAAIDIKPIDIPRLHRRLHAYAQAYGIPSTAVRQMDELLATPLAVRLLKMPEERLHDFLVLDAYKPRMHVMYDRFMDGVAADFALVVRHAPEAADPASLPAEHPELWASFEASATALSKTVPYGPYEVQALATQFGMALPRSLLDRCHRDGVAPVSWEQRHTEASGGRVAVASGPLISASLVETPLMQRFQQLTVAAQVEALRRSHDQAAATASDPCTSRYLDRTELLASSLARLAQTVDRINGLRHGCRVALFAGRRSSDLRYLVLQNLYCAAHLAGYGGTSSLFVAAVVCREWACMGLPEREQWGGAGRLVGTHAHEQASAMQQLLAPYDAEAGRRCGLAHSVAVSPLLAHLLFLAANGGGGPGGGGATALADTFTTAAFLAVARAAVVPAAFQRDVEAAHGWVVPEHARCFDLFRVWRLDSGSYERVADLVIAAWEARCGELRAEGRRELPRPELMHSNLDSVEHIAQMCQLDPRVRPTTLAFGTLADGFLPFLDPEAEHQGHQDDAAAAAAAAADVTSQRPTIGLASVVMKLVQARPPRPLPPLHRGAGTAAVTATPPCAVKLGDGDSAKVQVDPRLEPDVAQQALRAAVEMAHGSATSPLDVGSVSAVLAEAYDAVTRHGVFMRTPPPPVPSAAGADACTAPTAAAGTESGTAAGVKAAATSVDLVGA